MPGHGAISSYHSELSAFGFRLNAVSFGGWFLSTTYEQSGKNRMLREHCTVARVLTAERSGVSWSAPWPAMPSAGSFPGRLRAVCESFPGPIAVPSWAAAQWRSRSALESPATGGSTPVSCPVAAWVLPRFGAASQLRFRAMFRVVCGLLRAPGSTRPLGSFLPRPQPPPLHRLRGRLVWDLQAWGRPKHPAARGPCVRYSLNQGLEWPARKRG